MNQSRFAMHTLWHIGWRYVLARRWQSLLMIFGVALGVAVVIAIDLANASASKAFILSTSLVTGKATHQIEGAQGVDAALYTQLRRQDGSLIAAPIISEYLVSPKLGSTPMQLLGIDPFADAPFRDFWGRGGGIRSANAAGFTDFFTHPGAVLLSQPLAQRFGLRPGDTFPVVIGGYRHTAYLAGLLVPQDSLSQRTLDGVVLADIATAQEWTNQMGKLSRIDLILPANDPQAVQHITDMLPPGYRVVPAAARNGTIQQMSAAFQLNLSALSLLALVVGLFLIYNTMTFSVVQRRAWFGTLRCLGVTRREIFALVTSEAMLIGLLGGLLGIALGIAFGQVTVRLVTRTVNDLYFTTTVQPNSIDPASLLKGLLLGLMATVVTAALPAWEAASVPPRAALLRSGIEGKARQATGWAALAGIACAGVGALLFWLPSNSTILGFGGTLLVVVGFALLSAAVLVVFLRAARPITGRMFGVIGRMAPRSLTQALSRTSVAVAALMVAVAVIIGVSLMIDSFRYTVVVWLGQTLQGDVYVSVPGFNATTASNAIDPAAVDVVQHWPGVARVDTLRSIAIDTPQGPLTLSATQNPTLAQERFYMRLSLPQAQVWTAMQNGGVLISEPLANRMRTASGDARALRLATPQGWQDFPILGVYYDYASSEGAALMALPVYQRIWQDRALTALSLRLQPGENADAVARALQERLAGQQELLIRPNQALRSDVLAIFDRTFAITVALRVLATLVAFIGVLNALLLLQMEKQREVGILRALGLTGGQLWRLVMLETGLMGLVAGLLAMPTGYALAVILVYVINRRSFGWTLQMLTQPQVFLQALLIALAAALLAGVYPAWKMSRMSTAEVIRYE